jgi:hypothetical protein
MGVRREKAALFQWVQASLGDERMAALERSQRQLRVASASSVFSGADAQIGSADCLFIRPPVAALAEQRTVSCIGLYDRRGSFPDIAVRFGS